MEKCMQLENTPFFDKAENTLKVPIKMLRDLVLIYEETEQVTFDKSSLIIPEEYRSDYRTARGIVIAVGKGIYNSKGKFCPTELKVGDYVQFDRTVPWERMRVKGVDGEEHALRLMGERDVMGYVE